MRQLTIIAVAIGLMVFPACGDTASPSASDAPDLEATVEARVQATIEAPKPTPSLMPTATVVARSKMVRLITEDYRTKIENLTEKRTDV